MDPLRYLRGKIDNAKKEVSNVNSLVTMLENMTIAIEKLFGKFAGLVEETGKEFTRIDGDIKDVEQSVVDVDKKVDDVDKRVVKIETHKPKDGYTPVKGKDYFDGKDGYTPIKGKDYFDGKDGEDGVTTIIKEEENLSKEEIRDRLESLKGQNRLDASAIKNLPTGGTQRIGSNGVRRFTDMKDTPKTLVGSENKLLAVSSDGKKIEFVAGSAGGVETDPVYTEDKPNIALKSELPTDISDLTDNTNLIPDAYTLPTASSTVLGGVKVGSRLTITDGVLSADVQGGSGGIESVVAGTDISVDDTDPANPVVSFSGTIPEDISDLTDTTNLLGNATSIQGFSVTTTDPTDGKILVYRTATSEYVLEDKPVAGANPSAADVSFTPTGGLAADDVQGALAELDTEKASRNFVIAMSVAL